MTFEAENCIAIPASNERKNKNKQLSSIRVLKWRIPLNNKKNFEVKMYPPDTPTDIDKEVEYPLLIKLDFIFRLEVGKKYRCWIEI